MNEYKGPIRRVEGTYRGKPTHHYEDINGQRIPGVTTILSNGYPKPALVTWAAKMAAEYAINNRETVLGQLDRSKYETEADYINARYEVLKDIQGSPYRDRDAAANRGTEVHRLAEQLVQGLEVTPPAVLQRHVAHYVEFLDVFNPQPVLIESVVYNLTFGYAGTLDLIADMGGERWLLDLKTNRSGVFPEMAYQMAAYRFASHYIDPDGAEQPMVPVDRCAIVHVNEKGWSVVPVQADEHVLKGFRHISMVAREAETNGAYVGEPLEVTA